MLEVNFFCYDMFTVFLISGNVLSIINHFNLWLNIFRAPHLKFAAPNNYNIPQNSNI